MARKQCTVRTIRGERVETLREYMLNHLDNARDIAGVVSLTVLVEQTAASYDLYDGDDIPEALFELAHDVAAAAGELED